MADNRTVRVFVSSTFRDMMAERDELMTHTWPELRRFCRERQVELVEVDLRWGIAEEQSTRGETLKLCLDEIRACRPFFVGLLGERYGWVPGDDAFTADLAEEQLWLKDLHDKSVTELEIFHGVLNNPDMAGRAFFYFRDPAYARSRGADSLAENSAAAEQQTALKNTIRTTCDANSIPLHENYPDPVALAALVFEDLKVAIEEQYPVEDVPDPLTREANDHEAFAETRRRTYIGRTEYFEALDQHAAADGGPLVLLGDSGSGKSALLANWIEHWRKDHPKDLIVQHYIGGTLDSADHWRLMTRLTSEIRRWTDDPDDLPRSHDDILKTFGVWLAKARIKAEHDGVRCILVLDALNQLEDTDHSRLLGWLPAHPFTGPLRLIVSALPGDTLAAVEQRDWPSLQVQPLTPDERRRMIVDYLARFGKKLDAPRLDRLAAAAAAANPLYLRILLDELRVTGTHEMLDGRLGEYLASPDIPALLRTVLARYQHDYERNRPGLVSEALGLIWASRRGLSESELLQLLRSADLPQLPLAIWTPLRAALEEGLVARGGILNFAHDFLRTAVESAFVPGEDERDELRVRLADYFEVEPVTARSCDELPWLLWQTESRNRLRACLLDIGRFLEIDERDKDELIGYWVWLGDERTMGKPYLDSFENWSDEPGREETRAAYAANKLGEFLGATALYAEAEPLLERALEARERILGPEHTDTVRSVNSLAGLFLGRGDYTEAEKLYRQALEVRERILGPEHPDTLMSVNSLAKLLESEGDYEGAEPFLKQALEVRRRILGPEHPDTLWSVNDLAVHIENKGDYEGAERLYRMGLESSERVLGREHPDTLTSVSNLAALLDVVGDYEGAERLYRRALEAYERVLGKEHPNTLSTVTNLAGWHEITGDYEGAELLYRRALESRERVLGWEHPDTLGSVNNLAVMLYRKGDYEGATPLCRRAVEGILKISSTIERAHPNLDSFLANYAACLEQMGRSSDEVSDVINRMLEHYGIHLGGG